MLCPRRSGKSYLAAVMMVITCMTASGASCIYITLTRGMAKRILWALLKRIDVELELHCIFNNTDLTMTFPGGAMITLAGADSQHDIDKFRGVAFDLAIIDECKSFPPELINELVDEVLEPCLYDRLGTLILMGTPGAMLAGTFYDATSEGAFVIREDVDKKMRSTSRRYRDRETVASDYTWSAHSWTMAENEAMPHIWENALRAHKAKGESDQDPRWLREGLGQWIADSTDFVYAYTPERNAWDPQPREREDQNPWGLPDGHEWLYVMGVDMGYDDDFDIEVAAYSTTADTFYHVYGFAAPNMTISDIAMEIKKTESLFGSFEIVVGDRAGLAKTIFASLEEGVRLSDGSTYSVHIEAVDKHEKRDFIELLNSDLLSGKCKILRGSRLEQQMRMLQWDQAKRREDKSFPNHATDAFLYLCRHARHYFSTSPTEAPRFGTPEWEKRMDELAVEQIMRKRERDRHELFLDAMDLEDGDEWEGQAELMRLLRN